MNIQVYQAKRLPPRLDGKDGKDHYRMLFSEQSDRSSPHDTHTVYLQEDHVESVIQQAYAALPRTRRREMLSRLQETE